MQHEVALKTEKFLLMVAGCCLGREKKTMLINSKSLQGLAIRATDRGLGTVDQLYYDVLLSKKQVEGSPDIDTHKPVTRQHEASYLDYYGYPYYQGAPYLWGPGLYPTDVPFPVSRDSNEQRSAMQSELRDAHLATRNWWPGKKVLVAPYWWHEAQRETSELLASV